MKSLLLTNEYPPNVYGGAGVHVAFLSRELARLMEVDVRSFGEQRTNGESLSVTGYSPLGRPGAGRNLDSIFNALDRCIQFNSAGIDADVVHCHTWYTHFGGILAKLNFGVPLVVTVHSLEPLRPWKREQLGGGYDFSLWVEKTALEMADAVIAVSAGTRDDLLRLFHIPAGKIHVIFNGIDTDEFRPVADNDALAANGVDPERPYVLFVGRVTRQKGIIHLVRAIRHLDPGIQVVLCAGAPDTPEIGREMKEAVAAVRSERSGVVWIEEILPTEAKVQLYSHASLFCCPSIYEPFGIINLEAMACETPVVATAVGGIPEVVIHGETGHLVHVAQSDKPPFEPMDPDVFAHDLARPINRLMADPGQRRRMGLAGRKRAVEVFSWEKIARQTKKLYEEITNQHP